MKLPGPVIGSYARCKHTFKWWVVAGQESLLDATPSSPPLNIMAGKSAELDVEIARKAFGWKNIHQHENGLYGKKQDKLGRWRTTKVPSYSSDPTQAYQIDKRMKQLGLSKRYTTELEKMAKANRLPAEWLNPEQRCRAALKTLGSGTTLKVVKK